MKKISANANYYKGKNLQGTIVTHNDKTSVELVLSNGTKGEFNGVYEAAMFCKEGDINLKHHINNQPAAR